MEDKDGNRYIYAVIDWGEAPIICIIYSVVLCVAIPLFHVLLVLIKNGIMNCWLSSKTNDEKIAVIITDDVVRNDNSIRIF